MESLKSLQRDMDLSAARIILPGENDVYVSPTQIRRFNLKDRRYYQRKHEAYQYTE